MDLPVPAVSRTLVLSALLAAIAVTAQTLEANLVTMETTNKSGIILSSLVLPNASSSTAEGPHVGSAMECPTDDCPCELGENAQPVINCKWRKLQRIPVFKTVSMTYYEIDLSIDNFIKSLPNDAFKNLKVKNINLLGNELTANIEPQAFNGLEPYLEGLKIQGNGKIPIPFDKLTNLTNLKQLHVKNFQQSQASENAYFGSFPKLEGLKMYDINRLELDATTFNGKLPNLLHLELSNVYIDTIPVSSLLHLTGLQSLSIIKNNRLKAVYNNSFESLRNLQDLTLSHNYDLQQVDVEAFNGISKNLQTLHLGSNNLSSDSLRALSSHDWSSLTHLTLSYNPHLSPIQGQVFKTMASLQYLHMEDTGLRSIDQNLLSGLNNIFAINLGYNKIESIADRAFVKSSMLSDLRLHFQDIAMAGKSLTLSPNTFAGLQTALKHLDLRATPLETRSLWLTFESLKELQTVILRQTGIREIPNWAFHANEKLSEIDLQDNPISDLPYAAFKGLENSLTLIRLENTQLTSISECVFRNFSHVKEIGLRGNFLVCGCNLVWLHRFLHETLTGELMYRKDEYNCSSPAGKLLYDIPEETLCSNIVSEDCTMVNKSTTPTTEKPVTTPLPTPPPAYNLKLSIPTRTQSSMTLLWSVDAKLMQSITGYKILYYKTTDEFNKQEAFIHRQETFHVLENLEAATFYTICITAEVNNVWDSQSQVCLTTQTSGNVTPTKTEDNNRNIIIAAVLATAVVIVLISVGICAVIKYKYRIQQLQQIPLAMMRTGGMYGDQVTVCTIPNEYMTTHPVQMGQPYPHSPRMIQRQFGVDPDENPYHPYHRIKLRRNPYENDDEGTTDEEVGMNNSQEILCKPDLVGRHSAPSRLDAVDLLRESDKNSRPLPATPSDKKSGDRSKTRSQTLQATRGKKQGKTTIPKDTPENDHDKHSGEDDDDTLVLGKDPTYSRVGKRRDV